MCRQCAIDVSQDRCVRNVFCNLLKLRRYAFCVQVLLPKPPVLSLSRHLACRQVVLSIAVLVEDAEGRVCGVVLVGVPESVGHLEKLAGNRAPVLASVVNTGNSCTLSGARNGPRCLSDPVRQSAMAQG